MTTPRVSPERLQELVAVMAEFPNIKPEFWAMERKLAADLLDARAEVERLTTRCEKSISLLREFRDDWARHIKSCESEDCLICARRKDFMRRVLAELEGADQ